MTTEEYYEEKKQIEDLKELNKIQKDILVMELRTRYYNMSRYRGTEEFIEGNHLDTSRIKSSMIRVVDKL